MRRSCHSLDRLAVIFDDDHAVANAGLILPATLAQHLGLKDLFDEQLDLGDSPGRANVGIKAMTVIHSVLTDGDCIDDADRMWVAETPSVLGDGGQDPSRSPGTDETVPLTPSSRTESRPAEMSAVLRGEYARQHDPAPQP